ncbi:MAG TPA: hypothetical protein VFG90_07660, partial [Nitrososphaeraceae archaeon]|nr:hypothetical protein [Nitrososphaeraceae archaeon]
RSDKEYKERIKNLGLWLIPVILIPAIWPAYAISVGEYDNWYNGVFSQAGREGSGLGSLQILFKIDPVLVSIGIIGLIFAILKKRDIFLLLWIIPFLAFHIIVPWTQHFHWIQVLPVFCIAGAVLFEGLASIRWGANHTWTHGSLDDYLMDGGGYGLGRKLYRLYQRYRIESPNKIITIVTVTIILIFGMISTTMLVASNVNASFIEMVSFIGRSLPEYRDVSNEFDRAGESRGLCLWCTTPVNKYEENMKQKETKDSNEDNKVTVVGNHWIFGSFWIPKYVFNKDHIFKGFFTSSSVETEKVFIVADSRLLDAISSENPNENIEELKSLYDNLTTLATFEENRPDYDENMYPYQSMSENRGIGNIEIRANY